jgi:hypothetical protein
LAFKSQKETWTHTQNTKCDWFWGCCSQWCHQFLRPESEVVVSKRSSKMVNFWVLQAFFSKPQLLLRVSDSFLLKFKQLSYKLLIFNTIYKRENCVSSVFLAFPSSIPKIINHCVFPQTKKMVPFYDFTNGKRKMSSPFRLFLFYSYIRHSILRTSKLQVTRIRECIAWEIWEYIYKRGKLKIRRWKLNWKNGEGMWQIVKFKI